MTLTLFHLLQADKSCECFPLSKTPCYSHPTNCIWSGGGKTCFPKSKIDCEDLMSENDCFVSSTLGISCSWCDSGQTCMKTSNYSSCIMCNTIKDQVCDLFIFVQLNYIIFIYSHNVLNTNNFVNIVLQRKRAEAKQSLVLLAQDYLLTNAKHVCFYWIIFLSTLIFRLLFNAQTQIASFVKNIKNVQNLRILVKNAQQLVQRITVPHNIAIGAALKMLVSVYFEIR